MRSLSQTVIGTDRSLVQLVQRTALAAVMFPHGAQKLFGWFGGWGLDASVRWFSQSLHLPAPIALLVILSDVLGALALAFGAFTRLAALGTSAVMVGAVALVHLPNGFFMNWSGAQAGEGFEFHILALALSLPLMVTGGGAFSVDGWLARRRSASTQPLLAASVHA
jgi:putative oxidoreductase